MKKLILTLAIMLAGAAVSQAQDGQPFKFDTLYRVPARQATRSTGTQTSQGTAQRTGVSTQTRSSSATVTKTPAPIKKRKGQWSIGGGVGMSFGDYTNISISPQVGYSWSKYFTLGGGVSYNYYDDKDWDYKQHYLGGNIFLRAYPVSFLTVFVQPEIQHCWTKVDRWPASEKYEDTFGCLLVGGGLVMPMGLRGRMIASVYYDLIQNRNSPYGKQLGYSLGYSHSF